MEVVHTVRDILLSVFLLMALVLPVALLVFAYLLFRAARRLIRSATHIADDLGKVSEAAVDHIVTPLREGVSFSSVAGNSVGFATGFIAGLRGRRNRGKAAEETDGKGTKR